MSKIYLKVKIKSLADEAKIIHKEENIALARLRSKKCKDEASVQKLYQELRLHRKGIVASESRAALLAYALVRGKRYSRCEKDVNLRPYTADQIESIYKLMPNHLISRIGRLSLKYGGSKDVFYTPLENRRYIKPEILSAWFDT